MPAFSKMRRMSLPAHFGRGAVKTKEGNLTGNAFKARGDFVGRRDCGACSRTIWLPQPRPVGRAGRDAASSWIFFAGKLGHFTYRRMLGSFARARARILEIARYDAVRLVTCRGTRD